jgi:hypothetical protein
MALAGFISENKEKLRCRRFKTKSFLPIYGQDFFLLISTDETTA